MVWGKRLRAPMLPAGPSFCCQLAGPALALRSSKPCTPPIQPFDMATAACCSLSRAGPLLQRASGSLAASPLALPRRTYRTGRHSGQQKIVSMARKGLSELLSLGKK